MITRSYTGKTCRVVRNDWTNDFDSNPQNIQSFPAQAIASMQAGANHLGYPEGTAVDVKREFMPAGQGVGAITELVPAGVLVQRIIDEAEAIIERLQGVRR